VTGRKSSDKEARRRREKAFQLRCEGYSVLAISEKLGRCESQIRKDLRKHREEELQNRPRFDEYLVEHEEVLQIVKRLSLHVFGSLSRATQGDRAAAVRAASAQVGALKLVRDAQKSIGELYGLRLGRGANGKPAESDGQGQVVHQLVVDLQSLLPVLDRVREEENRRFRESHEKEVPQSGEEAE